MIPHQTLHIAMVALAACGIGAAPFAASRALAEDAPPRAATVPTQASFDDAIDAAARGVFSALPRPAEGRTLEVVVDPLVDGSTGARTAATRRMGLRIAAAAAKEFPFVHIVAFTPETLARNPILLIGAISSLASAGQTSTTPPQPPVYALWFTAADLSTRKILGRAGARALGAQVDPTPDPAYAEAPVSAPDPAVQGYIASCRKAKAGDALNLAYAAQLTASATLVLAEEAYRAHDFRRAREHYLRAAALPGGSQLRTLNGLYLTNMRLGDRAAASAAFSRLVDFGLATDRLAVKFLFRVNTPAFDYVQEARLYPQWLDIIAREAGSKVACLEVVGHTSPTGLAALNERLSLRRAEFVRDQLGWRNRSLSRRMIARGAGSSETIVGTGRDDASDALDRRVEMLVVSCGGALPAKQETR